MTTAATPIPDRPAWQRDPTTLTADAIEDELVEHQDWLAHVPARDLALLPDVARQGAARRSRIRDLVLERDARERRAVDDVTTLDVRAEAVRLYRVHALARHGDAAKRLAGAVQWENLSTPEAHAWAAVARAARG